MSDTILDRVVKLLNLAAGTTGPEAEVAAMRAAELMAKHQLDEAEVAARQGRTVPLEPIVVGRIDDKEGAPPRKAYNGWKGTLANVIANNFNGKCWRKSVYPEGHHLMMVGTQSAIDTARYLNMALARQLDSLVRKYLKETGGKGPQGNAYLNGAVLRISMRLAEGRTTVMNTGSSAALMIVNRDKERANEEMAVILGPRGGKAIKHGRVRDHNAMTDGMDAADSLDLGGNYDRLSKAPDQLKG